jgi:P-type E1-E2 ATPase
VLIAVDGRVTAAAGFGDPLRAGAAAALDRVRALGWRPGILSGDDARSAQAAGRHLGLAAPDCRGGVAPEDKLRVVLGSGREGPVVMIGDGVNDAAALAAAALGIAVAGGAEAALPPPTCSWSGAWPGSPSCSRGRAGDAGGRRNLAFCSAQRSGDWPWRAS